MFAEWRQNLLKRPRLRVLGRALLIAAGFAVVWWRAGEWYEGHLLERQHARVAARLALCNHALSSALDERLAVLRALAAHLRAHHSMEEIQTEFAQFAADLCGVTYTSTPGILNVTVAPGGVERSVYPTVSGAALPGHDLLRDPDPAVQAELERAKGSRRPVLTVPFELQLGGWGLRARMAVFDGQDLWGFTAISFDLSAVLEEAGLKEGARLLQIAVRDDRNFVFFGSAPVFRANPELQAIRLGGTQWELAAIPEGGWFTSIQTEYWVFHGVGAALALVLGCLAYVLVAWQTRLVQTVKERTQELSAANARLERDLAELRRAEEQIEFLSKFPGENPNPVLRIAPKGELLYANKAALPILDQWHGRVGEAVPAEWQAQVAAVLTSGTMKEVEVEAGGRVYACQLAPIAGAGYVNIYGRDITQRKQGEERLRRLNRLHAVLSQANAAVIRIGDRAKLLQEICRITVETGSLRMAWVAWRAPGEEWAQPVASWGADEAYPAATHVSARDADWVRGPTGRAIGEDHTTVCNDIEAEPRNDPWRRRALERKYQSVGAFPLHFQGRVYGALVVYAGRKEFFNLDEVHLLEEVAANLSFALGYLEEAAERRKAEAEVRRLNADLEQRVKDRTAELTAAVKEMESFSHSVSHDLRAPLRHMDGFVDLLEKHLGGSVDEQGRHYLHTIARAARQMGRLVDDLLVFAQMGRTELHRTPVDLGPVVQEAVEALRHEWAERRITWRIDPLPTVRADPAMLHQVFVNLLSNAVKYTRRRPEAMIQVGAILDDNEAVVFVRDNGVGFDMRFKDKLFGVFQRLHHSDEFEGTGIGLANVRRIIQRHGGRTWAESAMDGGATFYFSLPHTKEDQR